MSMRCELTGKSFQTGNNVSHAKNRTKRRFKPNLQNITFVSEVLGQKFQMKVAVSTIRTVEKKGGLDEFLINTPNSKLPLKAKKLKKTIDIKLFNHIYLIKPNKVVPKKLQPDLQKFLLSLIGSKKPSTKSKKNENKLK